MSVASNFKKLKGLFISDCWMMEKIFTSEGDSVDKVCIFPKLEEIHLTRLNTDILENESLNLLSEGTFLDSLLTSLPVLSKEEQHALASTPAHPAALYAFYSSCIVANFVEQLWTFAWPSVIALIHSSLLSVAVMGFFSTIFGVFGFGFGISIGLTVGYILFIYVQPTDVEDPEIKPLVDQDAESLQRMLPEIPNWIKNPDFDRVDWLNKFIELMWPYLEKAFCKTAKNIAKPIIEEQIPKYKIDSVEFQTLTLGTLPPTFQGMKVYVTDEKELIMEPSIKWAGNPNVTIAVKAFGLKATVQVVDLQVFLLPRITLKPLVPSFPCFANIFVSLMEKPHVDFGLKLMGADLMSIPGVYRIVQELIKDQVANMYLWPKNLEVQILDSAKALRRPVGILHVKVLHAMKLKKKDLLGASDPYVKLKFNDDKMPSKKTTVKHKNLNPEWNEEFNLVVSDPTYSKTLELSGFFSLLINIEDLTAMP